MGIELILDIETNFEGKHDYVPSIIIRKKTSPSFLSKIWSIKPVKYILTTAGLLALGGTIYTGYKRGLTTKLTGLCKSIFLRKK